MTAGRDITIKSGECGRRKNMAKYVFGVDVGGTTVKMGLFTVEGELLDKWEIKTRTEDGGKNVLPDIADSIKEVIESKKLAKEDVEGVGIGVPGPVKEDGTVLKCVNLGWGILNVEDELEKLVGYPVKAGNDANVAALGEMWQGGGKGHSNLVMVTLGTGVGGGIILNGKMLFGVNGAGGGVEQISLLVGFPVRGQVDGGDGQRPDGGRGCPQLLRQSHGSVGQIPDEMGGGGKLLLPGAVMEGRVPDGDLDAPGV